MLDLVIVMLLLLLVISLASRVTEGFTDMSSTQTIYINVGSYRDSECRSTVSDAFAKAEHPSRVFVGICQQNKLDSEDCTVLPHVDASHVRVLTLEYNQAKGPTYARYLSNTLYKGEDYVLQIDSHTRFVQGWDSKLVRMLSSCPSAKAVLTHYPHAYDRASADAPSDLDSQVPVMCRSKWNADGLPTFEAVMKPIKTAGLRQVPFVAGGMIFGPGGLFKEVALDPGLDFLFQGEEVLLSARMFTHGWDLFTPSENVVLHHYERKDGPRFWQDLQGYRDRQLQSLRRVKQLMGLEVPDLSLTDKYGMGRVRTLAQWWSFCRLDPAARTSASYDHFCRD